MWRAIRRLFRAGHTCRDATKIETLQEYILLVTPLYNPSSRSLPTPSFPWLSLSLPPYVVPSYASPRGPFSTSTLDPLSTSLYLPGPLCFRFRSFCHISSDLFRIPLNPHHRRLQSTINSLFKVLPVIPSDFSVLFIFSPLSFYCTLPPPFFSTSQYPFSHLIPLATFLSHSGRVRCGSWWRKLPRYCHS